MHKENHANVDIRFCPSAADLVSHWTYALLASSMNLLWNVTLTGLWEWKW